MSEGTGQEQWRGYDFTISENESTILLFKWGEAMCLLMDRTRKMRAQDVGTEHTLCRYTKDAM